MEILFIVKAALLGIVEGLTEFLPVSSTGHLVIFGEIMKFNNGVRQEFIDMFNMVIQLGAILSVIVMYWNKIWDTIKTFIPYINICGNCTYKESGLHFWSIIALACIPGAALVLPFDDWVEKNLFNSKVVSLSLVLGGIAMIIFEKKYRDLKGDRTNSIFKVTYKQALIIGIFQCLSIVPGMSRSASTIIGAWVAGLTTVAAAEFSFFLAIPVMFGMTTIKLFAIGGLTALSTAELLALGTAFLVAFIVAIIVIDKFIGYLKKNSMKPFAIYRFCFAVVVLISGFLNLI
ncbi:undecaprenyl-diphosphate phosphatase [uncultured Clostridium sp.]|uniref:undecaprenyl-diphosphate phosphatase n=1 Tax=uncultured Clostridium sp. TaxID=59620 RepID=UPI0025CD4AD4|nr:undecaprenyl-diphosphate phosphatase [uncultured Clostridium sp.]